MFEITKQIELKINVATAQFNTIKVPKISWRVLGYSW